MKLLVITQKIDINDPFLGFFHDWVKELSKYCQNIIVICLWCGDYDLPSNVHILSLGKEKRRSRLNYIINFYKYLWKENRNYDKVFVHMNPIYLVFAGWCWRFLGKKTALWYTHRQVDWKLKIAEKFVNVIFTAAKESFSLASNKLRIVGHGINTRAFTCKECPVTENCFLITHVGRITRIKNIETLIKAAYLLQKDGLKFKILLLGDPVKLEDFTYKIELEKIINDLNLEGAVIFEGSVPNKKVFEYYYKSGITVNLTPTGGVDKTVLESMASGVPVISSNMAFKPIFGVYADRLIFRFGDPQDLYLKIKSLMYDKEVYMINEYLKEKSKDFSIENLIKKIVYELEKIN